MSIIEKRNQYASSKNLFIIPFGPAVGNQLLERFVAEAQCKIEEVDFVRHGDMIYFRPNGEDEKGIDLTLVVLRDEEIAQMNDGNRGTARRLMLLGDMIETRFRDLNLTRRTF